jgi:hypothetical protein
MGCDVYANGNAIACKAGDDKVIAAFPDVCLSPPSPPAGPVPVPYPDTSFSKDMQNGSKTVMIKDKEVMLKDSSFYKTSPLGDEAATNGLGAGVVTHVITGKTYFKAWSMDVKFEGANVDRHLDLTTSNHASDPPNEAAPLPAAEDAAPPPPEPPLCECCNQYPPHSAAQAAGEEITEEEFYQPAQTGPRRRDTRAGPVYEPRALSAGENRQVADAQVCLQLTREFCPDQVPNNPPQGPCDKYYRSTQEESQAARNLYEETNNVANPDRPAAWAQPDVIMIAHRVPLAGGGCPVGPNATPVRNTPPAAPGGAGGQECADFDGVFGNAQNNVANIAR